MNDRKDSKTFTVISLHLWLDSDAWNALPGCPISIKIASILCQNVWRNVFFRHEPWHFWVTAHISVSLYMSLICLFHTLSVRVITAASAKAGHYTSMHLMLKVLRRWKYCEKQQTTQNNRSNLVLIHSPKACHNQHAWTITLHTSVVWNECYYGNILRSCELGVIAVMTWITAVIFK